MLEMDFPVDLPHDPTSFFLLRRLWIFWDGSQVGSAQNCSRIPLGTVIILSRPHIMEVRIQYRWPGKRVSSGLAGASERVTFLQPTER